MHAETATLSWSALLRSVFLALLATSVFALGARVLFYGIPHDVAALFSSQSQVASIAAAVPSPFSYDFKVRGTLLEAGAPDESSSPYWWLDSGAKMMIEDDVGKTVQGALPALDRWRIRYSLSSGTDTENGYAPQNLFRLLTRSKWNNVRIESSFRIVRDNFTESQNRNASNGLLLMSHYKDGDNLYYAGIRVDGHAVIKKKINGTYYTMAEKQIFPGEYVRENDINLLPHNEWIGLRSETKTDAKGAVTVALFMKRKDETAWTQLLTATDPPRLASSSGEAGDGEKYASTTPITGDYPVGIRTDFMDVEFDNFKAEKI